MPPRLVAALILAALASRAAGAQDTVAAPRSPAAPLGPEIQRLGEAFLAEKGGVGGLAVALVRDGAVACFVVAPAGAASGKASGAAPTAHTVYEVGSLTKTFTGLLLAAAAVEGRVRLRDDVRRYLPGRYPNLEVAGEPVRLRHLANMTSGLPDNFPRLPPGTAPAVRARALSAYTRAGFFRDLHTARLADRPGANVAHSNVASELLGYVLERVYGAPYPDLVRQRVAGPLGMEAASDGQPAPSLDARGRPMPYLTAPAARASGGLRFSAAAMGRYVRYQLAEGDSALRLTHAPTWRTLDGAVGVGLPWIVSRADALGRRLRYSGGTFGFASFVDLYPEARLGVALLTNGADDPTQDALQRLAEHLARAAAAAPKPTAAGAAGC